MEKFIGKHLIEDIEMLDNTTCLLTLLPDGKKHGCMLIEVEYWLDEKTWHFNESWFNSDGEFTYTRKCNILTDDEQKQCKELMCQWMKERHII